MTAELASVLNRAGAQGWIHVQSLDRDGEVGLGADELVVTASMFKIAVMLELARQAAAGRLGLEARTRVPAGRRTLGPTGISILSDDVELSVRDLAVLRAEVRRVMALQVWPHRLSSGFPDGVRVSAKTGTLPGIRNEVGVVEYQDGGRWAVAVFTRARSYAARQPGIDAAIGTVARPAIEHLRAAGPGS